MIFIFSSIINFSKALIINPRFISAKLNLGIVYQNLGKNEEALICLKEITKINNALPEVYNNMGFILYTQNKYSEAIKKLNKAIELKKDYAEAYLNLGMVYLNLKKYERCCPKRQSANDLIQTVYILRQRCDVHHRRLLRLVAGQLDKLIGRRHRQLLVLPLRPQYC